MEKLYHCKVCDKDVSFKKISKEKKKNSETIYIRKKCIKCRYNESNKSLARATSKRYYANHRELQIMRVKRSQAKARARKNNRVLLTNNTQLLI